MSLPFLISGDYELLDELCTVLNDSGIYASVSTRVCFALDIPDTHTVTVIAAAGVLAKVLVA